MPEQPGAGRLDPETLAAYIDGLLPPEERARVEAEIAADPDTYEWVVNSIGAVDDPEVATPAVPAQKHVPIPEPSPAPVPGPSPNDGPGDERKVLPFYRRRSVQGLLSTLLAAAAALVIVVRTQPVWWQELWGPSVDPRFAKLVEAVGEERYIEARLTGGFKYGPLRQVMRGPGDLSNQNLQLLAAAGELQKAAEKDPSTENLHSWGVAQLLLRDYEGAVDVLERANANESAAVASDLSAALATRATALGRDDDWPRALAAAERALKIEPRSVEAAFNRAYALQRMNLVEQARRYWDEYLQLDLDPRWRAEAERLRQAATVVPLSRVQELESTLQESVDDGARDGAARELARLDAAWARELLEDWLLPQLARAQIADRSRARLLATAERLAEEIASTGDPLSSLLVRETRAYDERRRLVAAAAWSAWQQGRSLYASNKISLMLEQFTRAEERFSEIDSLMRLWASHYRVVGLFYLGKLPDAEALCRRVLQEAKTKGFLALEARLLWDLGTIHYQRAMFEDALLLYLQAQERFQSGGELENVVAITQLIAEAYGRLGESAESWRHHRAAIGGLPRVRDPRRRHTVLAAAGHSALNLGMPEMAWHLFDGAVSGAVRADSPAQLVEALLNRARASVAIGDEADPDLKAAEGALLSVGDEAFRKRYTGDLMLAKAEAAIFSEPAAAVAAARAALEHASALGSEYRASALHLLAGRAALAAGQQEQAAQAFATGVGVLESKRAVVRQRELRISFLDSVFDLYRELVKLEVNRSDPRSALAWYERSRARTLLDDLEPTGLPLDVAALQARLQQHQGLLYLLSNGEECFAWLVRRDRLGFTRTSLSRAELVGSIGQWTRDTESGKTSSSRSSLRGVEEIVARALSPYADGLQQLAIVPDEFFEGVPFAALQVGGGYLFERFELVVAPSGTLALRSRPVQRLRRASVFSEIELAPALSRLLGPLPSSKTEAVEIAGAYSDGTLVISDNATPEAFLRALRTADVVHFAGHAIADPASFWRARLALSDDGSGGVLSLSDLPPASSMAKVVVLAACATGLGRAKRGEGVLSLARPLLRSGVSHVAVSKWRVADALVTDLSRRFHAELAQGGVSAPAALRAAQRRLVSSKLVAEASPGAWASLEIQGSF